MESLNYNAISYEADNPVERVEKLKWSLLNAPSVEDIKETYQSNDYDGHLVMKLQSEFVEPAVEQELKKADAWMKPPEVVDSGGVEVEVMLSDIPDQEFEDTGDNQVRKRGGSKIIAIPPDAASISDIGVGDRLNFYSRSGEILIQEVSD